MVTFFKLIFTWWHKQTLSTFFYTLLKGNFAGKDEFGNNRKNDGGVPSILSASGDLYHQLNSSHTEIIFNISGGEETSHFFLKKTKFIKFDPDGKNWNHFINLFASL